MTFDRLKTIIGNFKNVRIAVVGDMMLDTYVIGDVVRISPEAPVPVLNVKEEKVVLGGAANVLNTVIALGAKSNIYSIIGEDENGKTCCKILKEKNIDLETLLVDKSRPTTTKSRMLSNGQQLLRVDRENNEKINSDMEKTIIEQFEKNINNIDAVLISDYDKGMLTEYVIENLIKIAKKYDKKIFVDPKPHNLKYYVGVTVITPNRKEMLDYLGIKKFENENDLVQKVSTVREKLSLDKLILTRSEEGISLFEEGKHERVETVAREVYDVTGAGDTFISTLAVAVLAGANWSEAAMIGNIASGIVVGKVGTSVVTSEEILNFYTKFEK